MFTSKDHLKPSEMCGVVYSEKCDTCDEVNVGETERNAEYENEAA